MHFSQFLVAMACLFASTHAQVVEVESFTTGGCIPYPADGYCADVGLAGLSVFVFGDDVSEAKLKEHDAGLVAHISALETAARTIATSECISTFKLLTCYGWFPPCDGDMPLRACKSSCEATWEMCENAFNLAISLSLGGAIPQCDNDLINDARSPLNSMYNHYLESWDGLPVYADETYEATGPGGATKSDAKCASTDGLDLSGTCKASACPEPLVYYQMPVFLNENDPNPVFKNPGDMEYCRDTSQLNCTRCQNACGLPCPYPLVFEDGENAGQNLAVYLPGIPAFILNMIVFVSESLKIRRQKGSRKKITFADRLVQSSAFMALLLFFMETLPSMALGGDIVCDGLDFQSVNMNINGHDLCAFGELRHWVLIGLMATVFCNLYKVSRQLSAASTMKKYNPTTVERFCWVALIFIIPSILAAIALATKPNPRMHQSLAYRNANWDGANEDQSVMNEAELEDWTKRRDEATKEFVSLWHPNKLRGMFACTYFFGSVTQEVVLYTAPLMILGLACASMSLRLLVQVKNMNKGGNISKNKSLYSLAVNMLRFAAAAIILVLINTIVVGIYVPKAQDFGVKLEAWNNCLVSGINQEQLENGDGTLGNVNTDTRLNATLATCGNPREWAPSSTLLVGLNLSQSLPALAFGLVFSWPAMKQIASQARKGFSSVAPTSAMSSSN